MAFSGGGSGTTVYPYEITTASEFREMSNAGAPAYYKLMNDIDLNGGMSISAFGHFLSGCNYRVYGIEQSGNTYGFSLISGCTIEDITFETKGTYTSVRLFGTESTAINLVTLRNIHIKSFTAELQYISGRPFQSGCTIDNIIVEGKMRGVFSSTSSSNNATYQNLKILRTNDIFLSNYNMYIVGNPYGTLYRSQQIFAYDYVIFSGGSAGLLTSGIGGTVEQCFVKFNTIFGDSTSSFFQMLTYTSNGTGRIRDCYVIGNLFNVKQGSSGYLVQYGPATGFLAERLYYSGDIFRHNPYDSGVTFRQPQLSQASYTYYRKDLLSGFTATNSDIVDKQEGLTKEQFSGTTAFVTWDFENVWLSGETPTLIYNQEYTDFDWYTDPRVIIKNVTRVPSGDTWLWDSGYTSTGFTFELEVANVPEWGVDIIEGVSGITTKYNETFSYVELPEPRDYNLVLRPFWVSGGTTGYTNAEIVYYFNDYAVEASNPIIWTTNNAYRWSGTTINYSSGFTYNINSLSGLLPGTPWGTEVWNSYDSGGTILYSVSGTGSAPVPFFITLSSKTSDWFFVKGYYYENGIKKYYLSGGQPRTTPYKHWWWDNAVMSVDRKTIPSSDFITFSSANFPGHQANYVHGSCCYNDYVYGSTRSYLGMPGQIIKVKGSDYSDVTMLTVIVTGATTGYTSNMEQIKYCNGFLWTIGSGSHLIRVNPTTMEYDATSVNENSSYPIHATNDRYIYMHSGTYTFKYDTNLLTGATILTNVPGGDIINARVNQYNSADMGYYLEYSGPLNYTAFSKGYIHSIVNDEKYMYLAYTTGNELPWGTDTPDMMVHEIHKIEYDTMSGISYCRIPKTTDDMAHNDEWLFCGVETQLADALIGSAGAYLNIFAVDKATMQQRYNLPMFHSLDRPPVSGVTCYGTLVFGHYVIHLKTNAYLFVVDISNVTGWTLDSSDIGKYTLKICDFRNDSGGTFYGSPPPNEVVKDTSNNFHSFFWDYPSTLAKYRLDDFDFSLIKYGTIDVTKVYQGSNIMNQFRLNP